jgi:hypothetical protein
LTAEPVRRPSAHTRAVPHAISTRSRHPRDGPAEEAALVDVLTRDARCHRVNAVEVDAKTPTARAGPFTAGVGRPVVPRRSVGPPVVLACDAAMLFPLGLDPRPAAIDGVLPSLRTPVPAVLASLDPRLLAVGCTRTPFMKTTTDTHAATSLGEPAGTSDDTRAEPRSQCVRLSRTPIHLRVAAASPPALVPSRRPMEPARQPTTVRHVPIIAIQQPGLLVTCPHCGAPPFKLCRTRAARLPVLALHRERRHAAPGDRSVLR